MIILIILKKTDENGILRDPKGQTCNRFGHPLDDVWNVIPDAVVVAENAGNSRAFQHMTLGDYNSLLNSMLTSPQVVLLHSIRMTLS